MFRTETPSADDLEHIVSVAADHGVPAKTLRPARKALDQYTAVAQTRHKITVDPGTDGLAEQLADGKLDAAGLVNAVTTPDPVAVEHRAEDVCDAALRLAGQRARDTVADAAPAILESLDKITIDAAERANTAADKVGGSYDGQLGGVRTAEDAMQAGGDVRAAWSTATDCRATIEACADAAMLIRRRGLVETDGDAYSDGRYEWDHPAMVPRPGRHEDAVLVFLRSLQAGPRVLLAPVDIGPDPEPPRDPQAAGFVPERDMITTW